MCAKLLAFLLGFGALLAATEADAAACATVAAKSNLNSLIGADIPDNTSGAITPMITRGFLTTQVQSFSQMPTVNTLTGTNYTVVTDTSNTSDNGKLLTFNNGSPVAVALGDASTSGWCPFAFWAHNLGAGAVTITPAAGSINGAGTLVLAQNQGTYIVSDGINWQTGSSLTIGVPTPGTSGGVPYYNSTTTLAPSGLLTNNGIVLGGGAGAAPKSMSGTSGGVPYFNAATTVTSSAVLATNGVLIGGGAGAAPSSITACTTGQIIYGSAGAPACATPSSADVNVAAPTSFSPGTAAQVMQGLSSGTTIFTPTATGRVRVTVFGSVLIASVTNGVTWQIKFGTGSGPANNAAVTGTSAGSTLTFLAGAITERIPFTLYAVITGLTVNTPIWIDLALQNTTGAQTVTMTNVQTVVTEF